MSRIMVQASYDETGACVLRKMDGEEYLTIRPGDVVSPGNSIGGFFARLVRYADSDMISLVRVGGGLKSRGREAMEAATRRQRGFVLKTGRWLWATSSGSARNGIAHPVSRSIGDPLLAVIRLAGLGADQLKIEYVEALPGEVRDLIDRGLRYVHSYRYAADHEAGRRPSPIQGDGISAIITIADDAAVLVKVHGGGEATPITDYITVTTVGEVSRELMADVSARALFGPKADRDLAAAMTEELGFARSWVANHFDLAPSGRGDCLLVDGVDQQVFAGSWASGPRPLTMLIRQWGATRLLSDWLGMEQDTWIAALGDADLTVHYILDHFQVIAGERAGERYLSIDHVGDNQYPQTVEEWKGYSLRSDHYTGCFPPGVLLERLQHDTRVVTVEQLYARASQRQTYADYHRWSQQGQFVSDRAQVPDSRKLNQEEYVMVHLGPGPEMGAILSLAWASDEEVPMDAAVRVKCGLMGGDACFPERGYSNGLVVKVASGTAANLTVLVQRTWDDFSGGFLHHGLVNQVIGLTVQRSETGEVSVEPYNPGIRYRALTSRFELVVQA
jgi:hypothetical protein